MRRTKIGLDAQRLVIGGVPVDALSMDQLSHLIAAKRSPGVVAPPKLVFDTNGHCIAMAAADKSFARALAEADIIHADGQVVVAASRAIGVPIPERTATTDLIHHVAAKAETSGASFFLLGGDDRTNADAERVLRELYPRLRIAGRRTGYFSADEERLVVDEINASGADIVWVGMGKPKEQHFCVRNRQSLRASWMVTCGGCFSYLNGDTKRAPLWLQEAGLEWLYRMLANPRLELTKRYVTTNPVALWLILTRSRAAWQTSDER